MVPAPLSSLLGASGESAILAAMARELGEIVAPDLRDPAAIAMLDVVLRVMTTILARRLDEERNPLAGRDAVKQALFGVAGMARRAGAGTLADRASILATSGNAEADVPTLEGELEAAFAGLAATPAPVTDDELLPILRILFQSSGDTEERRRRIGGEIDNHEVEAKPSIISREGLEALLRALRPEAVGLRVTQLNRPSLGFGKISLIALLEGPHLMSESVVVRQDAEVTATDTCVVDEYPIVRYLFEQGLPVPEPLYLSAETGSLGRPFMLMAHVPGTVGGDPTGPAPECTREVLLDLARFAARLHRLDPSAADLPERWRQRPVADANRQLVKGMRRLLNQKARQPTPLLHGTLLWLEQNAPAATRRPSIVHTDLGLWNILVADGRVTGVLDWELARIGDPVQDLAYIRPLLADRLSWDEFTAAYLDAGGQAFDPGTVTFFEVLGDARNAVLTELMHHSAIAANAVDVRTAFSVTKYLRIIERKAAARIPGVIDRVRSAP